MNKFKKGDTVIVITGKEKGKTGKVDSLVKTDYVVIENINLYKKHIKKTEQNKGGIVDIPKPLHISNIAHYSTSKKVKSKIKFEMGKKGKQRILKATNEKI